MPGAGYADTRFGSIHYREAGEGDPLLLLHATPRSSRVYLPIMPFLADRFRVIAPDTLGFGDSAPLPANVTMEILAESVTALMDELGISRAAIFGLHTGNKIGAALAAGWPERVSRFMCCVMTHSLIVDQDKRNDAIGDIVAPYMAVEEAKGSRNLAEEWAKLFRSVEEIRQGQELRAPAQPGPEAFAAALPACRCGLEKSSGCGATGSATRPIRSSIRSTPSNAGTRSSCRTAATPTGQRSMP